MPKNSSSNPNPKPKPKRPINTPADQKKPTGNDTQSSNLGNFKTPAEIPQGKRKKPKRKITPKTIGPKPVNLHHERAAARERESSSRCLYGNIKTDNIVLELSRNAEYMNPVDICKESKGQLVISSELDDIFAVGSRKGSNMSLFSKADDVFYTGGTSITDNYKGSSGGASWLKKPFGTTPEKDFSSPLGMFERNQDDTPIKPRRLPRIKRKMGTTFPLAGNWWDILKMTDEARDSYIALFEGTKSTKGTQLKNLWDSALNIIYKCGEEVGAWGNNPCREKELASWRANMILSHDLTIPAPVSWNSEQRSCDPRPSDVERRMYTENFHKMYNNTRVWRVRQKTWKPELQVRYDEASAVVYALREKYPEFLWFCMPLPSENWEYLPQDYVQKPGREYYTWIMEMIDHGLINGVF